MVSFFLFPLPKYNQSDILSYCLDPGPHSWDKAQPEIEGELSPAQIEAAKPILRAVVFDFSGVSNMDTTSIQNLVDLRRVLERYAAGEVEFHFATILSPWIKRLVFLPDSSFTVPKTDVLFPLFLTEHYLQEVSDLVNKSLKDLSKSHQ